MYSTEIKDKALKWWDTIGDNFLDRIILKGELCTKYHGQFRRTSSLKDDEITAIYLDIFDE
jgi:hypothetical protein